jgi:rhomboid protease GluP
VQWKIGFDLERVWGWHRVMFIYFISGIGGNIFSVMLMSNVVSVGASGALMGLYGGIVADNIINWYT